jgi:hypothetical protein
MFFQDSSESLLCCRIDVALIKLFKAAKKGAEFHALNLFI